MKLELKHLAGYLPYELKIKCGEITRATLTLDTVTSELISVKEILLNNAFKPILRPLSDLTKEIEVNGKKFVPVLEFRKIHDTSASNEDIQEGISDQLKTDSVPHWIVKKLYEWHFDIHGLIENNLAIDINTL